MESSSLRTQVIITFVSFFLLIILFFSVYSLTIFQDSMHTTLRNKVDSILNIMLPYVSMPLELDMSGNLAEELDQLMSNDSHILHVKVVAFDERRVLYNKGDEEVKDSITRKRLVVADDETTPLGTLTITYSMQEYNQAIKHFQTFLLIAGLVGFFLVFVFLHFVKYILEPLKTLTDKLKKFSPENIEKFHINKSSSKNEIGVITNVVESMMEKVKSYTKDLEHKVEERTKELKDNYEELNRTKNQLVESEKMASLGTLVAGVSHEINTPVGLALTGSTHIKDEAQNLKRLYDSDEMSEEDFEDFLYAFFKVNDSVILNLRRSAELIKSFKQVAVDQSSDEDRRFNLNEYIHEILLSLHNKTKKSNHKIVVEVDETINIFTNPGAIYQIITNFVMNSLIHAFENGESGVITISAYRQDESLLLLYEDNGRGLTQEVKARIFDPFFTTNRGNGGSGLGMNVVYNLVASKLRGEISIESELGKGVKFTIKLPLDS